mmetsp:Transcript_36588/g.114982  ORF Transcript_36588/g.114982 Transcript_36588/m.114982 type:complete len:336 (-) Transcript_36588:355-1362(-)
MVQLAGDVPVPLQVVRLVHGGKAARRDELEDDEAPVGGAAAAGGALLPRFVDLPPVPREGGAIAHFGGQAVGFLREAQLRHVRLHATLERLSLFLSLLLLSREQNLAQLQRLLQIQQLQRLLLPAAAAAARLARARLSPLERLLVLRQRGPPLVEGSLACLELDHRRPVPEHERRREATCPLVRQRAQPHRLAREALPLLPALLEGRLPKRLPQRLDARPVRRPLRLLLAPHRRNLGAQVLHRTRRRLGLGLCTVRLCPRGLGLAAALCQLLPQPRVLRLEPSSLRVCRRASRLSGGGGGRYPGGRWAVLRRVEFLDSTCCRTRRFRRRRRPRRP